MVLGLLIYMSKKFTKKIVLQEDNTKKSKVMTK